MGSDKGLSFFTYYNIFDVEQEEWNETCAVDAVSLPVRLLTSSQITPSVVNPLQAYSRRDLRQATEIVYAKMKNIRYVILHLFFVYIIFTNFERRYMVRARNREGIQPYGICLNLFKWRTQVCMET